jgi:hypothetical protein
VLYEAVERLVMWMDALPPFPVMLLLGVVLGLPTTVIHEVGHGLAANWIARVPVKIEIWFKNLDWAGHCLPQPGREVTLGAYMAVVAAGPFASLLQGVVAGWLTTLLTPGTITYAIVAVFALWGWLAGLVNLVPLTGPGVHSDGQKLLDLTRLAVTGHVAAWLRPPAAQDPHAATSVAPPG